MLNVLRASVLLLMCPMLQSLTSAEPTTPVAPREVEVKLYVLDIVEIDEPTGQFAMHVLLGSYWQDPALVSTDTQPRVWREDAALEQVNSIWWPMVEFNRTTEPEALEHALLRIHPDGRVEFERQMDIRISTVLDLRRLPFDTQSLKIELESFQHQADAVVLSFPDANLHMTKDISLPQWQVGRTTTEAKSHFNEVYKETYSRAIITIEVKRRYQFYIWQMMVPLGILIGMAFAVFFLPPADLADRMNVIIASLLTVVALSYSLHSDLPKVPYLTVIDWLFVLAYVFFGLAMAGMVWVHRVFDHNEAHAVRIDRRLRWAYPAGYLLVAGSVIILVNV